MNNYGVYIKSHTEAPDYEAETMAKNKEEAIEIFLKSINQGNEDPWDKAMIEPYVEEIDEHWGINEYAEMHPSN